MTTKRCNTCKVYKPLDNFYNLKRAKDGKNPKCKECSSKYTAKLYYSNDTFRQARIKASTERQRKSKYGVSPEEFNTLLKIQNYCCAICNIHLDNSKFSLRGQLDHCHKTKQVRGILCGQCNTALGLFKDNKEIIMTALEYLDQF